MAVSKTIKLDRVALMQPILIGSKQIDNVYEKDYTIILKDNLIQIVDKQTGCKAFTSLFNTKWFLSSDLEF